MEIRVKKIHHNAIMPTRAYDNDAGMDVYTIENGAIMPHSDALIKIGISIAIPDGWVGFVKEKSGRAVKNKITIGACVIDSGYRGELMIHLFNNNDIPFVYKIGEAIAQIVIIPCWIGQPIEVEELDDTTRGEGGFGSTGVEARIEDLEDRTIGLMEIAKHKSNWKENIQKNMDDHLEYGTSLVCDPDDVDACLEEHGYPEDNSEYPLSQDELEKLDETGMRWEFFCEHGYPIGSEYCPQCRHKKGGPDQDNKYKKGVV